MVERPGQRPGGAGGRAVNAAAPRAHPVGYFEWLQTFRAAAFDVSPGKLSTAKAVGFMLATYADNTAGDNIHPGHDLIGQQLGMTPKTVGRCVASLESAGYLQRVRRGTQGAGGEGMAAVYRLTVPASVAPQSLDTRVRSLARKWGESMDTGV